MNMYLTLQTALVTAVLGRVPFSLAFSFDARAIYQQASGLAKPLYGIATDNAL